MDDAGDDDEPAGPELPTNALLLLGRRDEDAETDAEEDGTREDAVARLDEPGREDAVVEEEAPPEEDPPALLSSSSSSSPDGMHETPKANTNSEPNHHARITHSTAAQEAADINGPGG